VWVLHLAIRELQPIGSPNRLKIATTLQSRRQKIRHFFAVPTDPYNITPSIARMFDAPAVNLASEHARLAGRPHGCDAPREASTGVWRPRNVRFVGLPTLSPGGIAVPVSMPAEGTRASPAVLE